jgi:hypothetical protein
MLSSGNSVYPVNVTSHFVIGRGDCDHCTAKKKEKKSKEMFCFILERVLRSPIHMDWKRLVKGGRHLPCSSSIEIWLGKLETQEV